MRKHVLPALWLYLAFVSVDILQVWLNASVAHNFCNWKCCYLFAVKRDEDPAKLTPSSGHAVCVLIQFPAGSHLLTEATLYVFQPWSATTKSGRSNVPLLVTIVR